MQLVHKLLYFAHYKLICKVVIGHLAVSGHLAVIGHL